MKNINHSKAYTFIIIAIIFWGISFLWTNQLIKLGVPITTFLFLRLFIAGIILFVFSIITKRLQKLKRKDWKWMLLMVFFEPFIYFMGEDYGMKYTGSPTLTAVIIATIPIFTMVTEIIIYHIKLTFWNILGVFLTLPGIVLMVLENGNFSSDYWWGILLLLIAVIGAVGYSAVVKNLTDKYNTFTLTTYQFIIGALFFLPFVLIKDVSHISEFHLLSLEVLTPLLCLAVLCSACAFWFYIESIKDLGMTKSCIFTAIIPGISALVAYLMGQETITPLQTLGIIIVVFGVMLAQLKIKRKKKAVLD
ncbi:MAG: DMT family transporter [Bacteroidales bacterium]